MIEFNELIKFNEFIEFKELIDYKNWFDWFASWSTWNGVSSGPVIAASHKKKLSSVTGPGYSGYWNNKFFLLDFSKLKF